MTELEEQLRTLVRPTRPLVAGDLDEAGALGGTRDHRRVVWRLAAASVVVLALIGSAFALGRRSAPVDTLSPTTRTFIAVPEGDTTPERLAQAATIVQARLRFELRDATAVARDGTIEISASDGLTNEMVDRAIEPGGIEFRPVLIPHESPSPSPGASLPSPPATTLPVGSSGVLDSAAGPISVGPAGLVGGVEVVESHGLADDQVLQVTLEAGPEGIDGFDAIAAECYQRAPSCMTGQIAIVVNGVVVSAPTIESPHLENDRIELPGSYTQASVRFLAILMSTDRLPVRLHLR